MDVSACACACACACGYVTEGCGSRGLLKVFLFFFFFLKKTSENGKKNCVCDRLSAIDECLSQCRVVFAVIQQVRSNIGQEIRPKAKGFQLSLERYNGKPKSDLTTWIAQVEEKCALQNISNEEIGKWAKVHLA